MSSALQSPPGLQVHKLPTTYPVPMSETAELVAPFYIIRSVAAGGKALAGVGRIQPTFQFVHLDADINIVQLFLISIPSARLTSLTVVEDQATAARCFPAIPQGLVSIHRCRE